VGLAIVALMVAAIVLDLLLHPQALCRHPRGARKISAESPALVLMVAVPFFSVLLAVAIAARSLAASSTASTWAASASAPARGRHGGDGSGPRARLPERGGAPPRARRRGRPLERAGLVLHVAASPWPTYCWCSCSCARFLADARGYWFEWAAFMGAVWLAAGRRRRVLLALVAGVDQRVDVAARPAGGILHRRARGRPSPDAHERLLPGRPLLTLGFRAGWLRGDVLRERAALC
jgi:hypothetical protein